MKTIWLVCVYIVVLVSCQRERKIHCYYVEKFSLYHCKDAETNIEMYFNSVDSCPGLIISENSSKSVSWRIHKERVVRISFHDSLTKTSQKIYYDKKGRTREVVSYSNGELIRLTYTYPFRQAIQVSYDRLSPDAKSHTYYFTRDSNRILPHYCYYVQVSDTSYRIKTDDANLQATGGYFFIDYCIDGNVPFIRDERLNYEIMPNLDGKTIHRIENRLGLIKAKRNTEVVGFLISKLKSGNFQYAPFIMNGNLLDRVNSVSSFDHGETRYFNSRIEDVKFLKDNKIIDLFDCSNGRMVPGPTLRRAIQRADRNNK